MFDYGYFVDIIVLRKYKNHFELFLKVINLIRNSLKYTPYKLRSAPSLRLTPTHSAGFGTNSILSKTRFWFGMGSRLH